MSHLFGPPQTTCDHSLWAQLLQSLLGSSLRSECGSHGKMPSVPKKCSRIFCCICHQPSVEFCCLFVRLMISEFVPRPINVHAAHRIEHPTHTMPSKMGRRHHSLNEKKRIEMLSNVASAYVAHVDLQLTLCIMYVALRNKIKQKQAQNMQHAVCLYASKCWLTLPSHFGLRNQRSFVQAQIVHLHSSDCVVLQCNWLMLGVV
jgi:hypothetical protein